MNTKPIPVLITLLAAVISSFISIIQGVDFATFVGRLLLTVFLFYLVGIVVGILIYNAFPPAEKAEKQETDDGDSDEEKKDAKLPLEDDKSQGETSVSDDEQAESLEGDFESDSRDGEEETGEEGSDETDSLEETESGEDLMEPADNTDDGDIPDEQGEFRADEQGEFPADEQGEFPADEQDELGDEEADNG